MIIDCTMFAREHGMLALRMAELADVVDLHIITEGNLTYQGTSRDVVLPMNDHPKVRNHVAVLPTEGIAQFDREIMQRNLSLEFALQYAGPGDMILLADMDEIPHPDAIRQAAATGRAHRLMTDHRNWFADYRMPDHRQCYAQPLIGPPSAFGQAQATRYGPGMAWPSIGPRGWHLSNVGSADDVLQKLDTHAELHKEDNSLEDLVARRDKKLFAFAYDEWPGEEIQLTYTEDLPRHIQQFPQFLGGRS